ncbi:putative formate dehydrogenase [mine drainage metagenome]|uniref:Putative formate dehydrogenase n=1 Tax=mine drainage metagenome TaxID=410659 RepID=A0A1J5PYT3_9ZZZZ
MRVVPLENESVNECWLADRDRYSYEALNSPDRLATPMIKHGGEWKEVDWKTALEYVVHGLKSIKKDHGAASIGALLSPHSTLEEIYLAGALVRGLGSENVDYRLRHAEFPTQTEGARHLGMTVAGLSKLQRVLVVGSDLRKDHPLFAQRIRQAARGGCEVNAVSARVPDWAMSLSCSCISPAAGWVQSLADIAAAVGQEKNSVAPHGGVVTQTAQCIARSLLSGERKAVLLGNAAAHHPQAGSLLTLANWIAAQTGATVGYLTEAANTVGAQLVGALPGVGGLNAGQMLAGALKAAILLNCEPGFDSCAGDVGVEALKKSEMVVTLSPFKANLEISDVLLPIAPFTETSGTFVNAEGRIQSFHAVVRPLGETRPAWKVFRALADILGMPGFTFDSSKEVLNHLLADNSGVVPESVSVERLSNACSVLSTGTATQTEPCVASIYQLDGIVRRAPALQLTADARAAETQEVRA